MVPLGFVRIVEMLYQSPRFVASNLVEELKVSAICKLATQGSLQLRHPLTITTTFLQLPSSFRRNTGEEKEKQGGIARRSRHFEQNILLWKREYSYQRLFRQIWLLFAAGTWGWFYKISHVLYLLKFRIFQGYTLSDGFPRVLRRILICPETFLPGNNSRLRSISARMHPTAHMSTAVPCSGITNKSSGALNVKFETAYFFKKKKKAYTFQVYSLTKFSSK